MHSKDLIRGTLTPIILRLLHPDGKMYGYEICQKVKQLTDGSLLIREGSLYPALHRLKDDGLIQVEEVMIGNRPRRYYQLTEEGRLEAEKRTTEFSQFLQTMQLFMQKATG
ncbi:MAG: helix-turn-helix transcriptional regulator [Cytophagales bacterium]|nr:helix-turn-helix transcriptional regulator [Cytophagales bacterium]